MRNNIFYYLAPVFRVSLFILLCFICIIPFGLLATSEMLPPAPNKLLSDISAQFSLVIVVVSALLMMFRFLPYLDFFAIYVRKEKSLPTFLKGAAFGLLFMFACAALLHFNGNVVFNTNTLQWTSVGLYAVLFLLVAAFEEMLFRTYVLFAFAERYPLWFSIFFNAIMFALAHVGNPDPSLLGILNIALAGVVFSIYVLQRQNIMWAIGIHFGWNFTQGIVLGYNVSGNNMGGPGAFIATPQGADYLSGGKFGIEGSIWCTLLLVVWIAWLVYKNGLGFVEIHDPQVIVNDGYEVESEQNV
jgi:membrane protease YdiL (CAAX protease family)